jgi:hypothetical protein
VDINISVSRSNEESLGEAKTHHLDLSVNSSVSSQGPMPTDRERRRRGKRRTRTHSFSRNRLRSHRKPRIAPAASRESSRVSPRRLYRSQTYLEVWNDHEGRGVRRRSSDPTLRPAREVTDMVTNKDPTEPELRLESITTPGRIQRLIRHSFTNRNSVRVDSAGLSSPQLHLQFAV